MKVVYGQLMKKKWCGDNIMKKAIVTIGIPTSGKSTFADSIIEQDPSYIEICRDNIRREIFNVNGWNEYNNSAENEKLVTAKQFDLIREAHNNGKNIIITDTNLRMKYVRNFVSLLEHFGYTVNIKLCEISFLESIRRNANRSTPTDINNLRSMHKAYNTIIEKVKDKYPNYIID